jgi:hypothetical protein
MGKGFAMTSPVFPTTSVCRIAAQGVVSASLDALSAIRNDPGDAIPPRFLRHADEQTVVGVAAVLQAMGSPALSDTSFQEWGVVAAPMFPGRLSGALTFRKFQRSGSGAISPHVIPQNSLHSLSSAVSIGLSMHGPNFGIGGGPEAFIEGLTVAMSLLDPRLLPGLWLVLTQWVPEPIPDGRGSTATATECLAVALALLPDAGQQTAGLTLRFTPPGRAESTDGRTFALRAADDGPADTEANESTPDAEPALVHLARWLKGDAARGQQPWSYGFPWGGRVEMIESSSPQQAKAA